MRALVLLAAVLAVVFLSGCAGGRHYEYRYVKGKTATVRRDGTAVAPPRAPREVHAAIDAGNRIVGAPYRRGGGHGVAYDTAYDCSGAVSYVLRNAGLMRGSMPSRGFRRYGEPGKGDWITVYADKGHVFLVVAGLRFDTGWTGHKEGPRWTTRRRPLNKSVARHPRGL